MIQGFKYRSIGQKNDDGQYRDMESLIHDELYAPCFHQLNDPFEAIATKTFGDAMQFLKNVALEGHENIQELSEMIIAFRDRAGVYSLSKSLDSISNNPICFLKNISLMDINIDVFILIKSIDK